MKGQGMALDTVVKFIILIVVALVVIGLVIYFSDDIKNYLKNWLGKSNEVKVQKIEADSFSTTQVMTYIRGCWDMTGENFHEDVTCYILVGDLSGVDKYALGNTLSSPAEADVSKFDPSKTMVIISFEDVGNIVHVES